MIKRFDLPDGYWADMIEAPNHGEYYELQRAQERASNPLTGSTTEAELAFGRVFTKAWNLEDEQGRPVPLSDWTKADPRLTEAICAEAVIRYQEWEARRPPLAPRTPDLPKPDATPETPSGDTSEASE